MNLGDLEGIARLTEFGLRQLKRACGVIRKWRRSRRQDGDKLHELQKLVKEIRADCEDALSDSDWTNRDRKLNKLAKRTRVRKIQELARDFGGVFGDLHSRTESIKKLQLIHQSQVTNVNEGRAGGDFPRSDLSNVPNKLNDKLKDLREYIDTEISKLPKEKKWA